MSPPFGWRRTRVDRVATVNARIGWKALTANEYQPDGYAFLATPNIKYDSIDFENVNYINEYRYEESPELKLELGDVLLVKDGNTLGITNVVRELPRPATVNGSIAVLRAFGIEPRFLRYSLASSTTQSMIDTIKGGMGVPHLFQWDIKRLPLVLPLLEEQRRIADFLDAETARIDALTEARSRALSLLEERASAIIRRALQGGNLDSRDVSSSAVPWLDRHPEHWKAAPLRYLSRIQRGASPRPIEDPIYFDDEGSHGWVRISDVTSSQKYLKTTEQRLSPLGRQLSVPLEPGELFLSIAATVGKPIITRIPCCIHDGFVAIRRPQLNTEFLYYALLLGDAFRGLGKLGTQLNLNSDTVGSIIMPVPPAAEQQMLIAEIEGSLAQISSQRCLISRQLALLFERRKALITAAVTGQIDVTTGRGVSV